MPTAISIPISVFDLWIAYEQPDIRILADRGTTAQVILNALTPWNISIDDLEVISAGKLSDQGIKVKIPNQGTSAFFFGGGGLRFTKDPANWSDAEEVIKMLGTVLEAVMRAMGVKLGKRRTVLSLHLQPQSVQFREILRPLIAPSILSLDPEPPQAMAVFTRWKDRKVTIDGSAALANGIFLQLERDFDVGATLEQMKAALFNDQLRVFKLLDVEEVS